MAKSNKGGLKMYGPLATPMDSQIKPLQIPKIAVNTTMGGTAPKKAPIMSPGAGYSVHSKK